MISKYSLITFILSLLLTISVKVHANSAEAFFAEPTIASALLSPDGEKIASIGFLKDVQHIFISKIGEVHKLSVYSADSSSQGQEVQIASFDWIDSQHLAIELRKFKTQKSSLIDSRYKSHLLIIRLLEGNTFEVLRLKTSGQLIHPLPKEERTFLYAKNALSSKVYKLSTDLLDLETVKQSKLRKIDGGQFVKSNQVNAVDGQALRWFFDADGQAQSVLFFKSDPDKGQILTLSSINANKSMTQIKTWTSKELDDSENTPIYIPRLRTSNPKEYICTLLNEENKRTLYRVNFETDKVTEVFTTEAYEIISMTFNYETDALSTVVLVNDGKLSYRYINNKDIDTYTSLSKRIEYDYVARINTSNSQNTILLYAESHNKPGAFFTYTKSNNELNLFANNYENLPKEFSSTLITGSVQQDELNIPYLLSIPVTNQKSYPLIVMPHGGPIGVFDDRYYHQSVQFLNASGYAVLRVNFRGSSGYSDELREAGKQQWGGKILSDISAATKEVLKRSDINEFKVCTFGSSYGGYAAIMLAILEPKMIRCAASFAGVTDINLLINQSNKSKLKKKWAVEYIGDPETQYDELKKASPLYRLNDLKTPLLIAHGGKDRTVLPEHYFRLTSLLEKHNTSYESVFFEDAEHNFATSQQAITFYNKLLQFFEKHLNPETPNI